MEENPKKQFMEDYCLISPSEEDAKTTSESAPQPPQGEGDAITDKKLARSAKRAYSTVGFSMVLYIVVTYVMTFACMLALLVINPDLITSTTSEVYYWVCAIIPQYVVALPIALLALYPLPRAKLEKKKISFPKLALFFIICFGVSMIGSYIGSTVMNALTTVTGIKFSGVVEDMLGDTSIWYNIIVAAIIGPIFEELLFRKLLIDRLAPYGQKSAIIISAVLFGLLHGNLEQLFYAILIGLILGYVYCNTGKIRYTIAIHMGFNALAGVFPLWLLKHIDLEKFSALESTEEILNYAADKLGYILLIIGYEVFSFASMISAVVLIAIFVSREYAKLNKELMPPRKTFRLSVINVGMITAMVVFALQFIINIISFNVNL